MVRWGSYNYIIYCELHIKYYYNIVHDIHHESHIGTNFTSLRSIVRWGNCILIVSCIIIVHHAFYLYSLGLYGHISIVNSLVLQITLLPT